MGNFKGIVAKKKSNADYKSVKSLHILKLEIGALLLSLLK